jgi:hypothetical protein
MPGSIKTYQNKRGLKMGPDIIIGTGMIMLLLTLTLLFGLAIFWLNHNPIFQDAWKNFSVDKKTFASFCESTGLSNPVRHPVSTFSNIVYLIIAVIILKKSREERLSPGTGNLMAANKNFNFLFGIVLLYVFAASTFYHASLINLAYRFDYSAVFSFSLFPIMYYLQRLWFTYRRDRLHISKKGLTVTFYLVYIVACILLSFFTPKEKESTVTLILILAFFTLAVLTETTEPHKTDLVYLALSITSVLMALIWFQFDKSKVLCNPNSYFQPHSMWNLFIGVSAFYFYLYLRSERDSGAVILENGLK